MEQDKILNKDIIKTARKLLEGKWSRLAKYTLFYILVFGSMNLIIEILIFNDIVSNFFLSNTNLTYFYLFLFVFKRHWFLFLSSVGAYFIIKNVFENKEFKISDGFIALKNKTFFIVCSIWVGIYSLILFLFAVFIAYILFPNHTLDLLKYALLGKEILSELELNNFFGSIGTEKMDIIKYFFWIAMFLIVLMVQSIYLAFWPIIYINSDTHFLGKKTTLLKNNAVHSVLLSIKLVHKNFGRVFLFGFRFIPWFLLLFATLGIFALWLSPLITLSYYILYQEIIKNKVTKLSSNSIDPQQISPHSTAQAGETERTK